MDVRALLASLRPLAELKRPGFDWGIAHYQKCRRSQGPGREGLIKYLPVLEPVCRQARRGLPSQGELRSVWRHLDSLHHISAGSVMADLRSPTSLKDVLFVSALQ